MRGSLPKGQRDVLQQERPGQQSKVRSWLASLKSSWRMVLQFDRSQITAFQALRSAFGVVLPLAAGIATGQTITGVAIASGSLMLGSVGLKEPTPTRVRLMLLDSLFITLSALIGGIVGGLGNGWLLVIVIGIWGFGAGIFASLSPATQIIGIQSCVALIIYSHLELDPLHATITAGLVSSGALFQTLLALLPSPWTNTAPERSALAAIYQKLADYAANPSQYDAFLVSDALLAGRTALLYSNTRAEKGQMFARLLEQAERLRLALTILINQRQHVFEGEREKEPVEGYLDRIVRLSADELRAIAQELHPSPRFMGARGLIEDRGPARGIKQALAELHRVSLTADKRDEIGRILPYCTALLGELHIAMRLATSWKYARQHWPTRIRFPYPRPPRLHLDNAWSNIRANLTPRSSAFRHAIRLGVTLMVATTLYQVLRLQNERGYWIPVTAALVLRSDFITTFTRGIARLLGTMLGAVLTTLLVVFLVPSQPMLVALIAVTTYLMFATLFANYTIFSASLTIAAVLLLSFVTPQTLTVAADRALDTAIGGLLALAMYAIWPTWERSQVPENIARRLEALSHYLNAIMQGYAYPEAPHSQISDRQHIESRLARSNALGSVRRSLQEPETYRVNAELAEGLLEAADGIARSTLTLEAYLFDNPQRDTLPDTFLFSTTVEEALNQLAAAVRERRPAPALPNVEGAFKSLKAAIKAKKPQNDAERAQWQFVIEEAKRIVANLQAMRQLLSTGSLL